MELKPYQSRVIQDLEMYLEYLQKHKRTDMAFDRYWEDRIGPYDPLAGKGMEPYKNTIPTTPNVCIKVPTAGGKTFIACNALQRIFSIYPAQKPQIVVWLVPWSNLLDQTVAALSDPAHPYRQKLNSLFGNRVEVYEKEDLIQGTNFNPSVIQEQLSIMVMNFASLRAKNKEDRKVYQENGHLASFSRAYGNTFNPLEEADETSLINVIRNMDPVVVVDESHNAESALSVDMLQALNPSFVLDLTATPKNNSNIISFVPAIELKKEHMVKLPVIVYNHRDKTDVVSSALHLQRKLELLAIEEEKKSGRYIRPIVLFQAQPKTGEENITYTKLKKQLLAIGIPEGQIKIKTATLDELKNENLFSRDCEVRYIITINALKEGWDCPFAYVLASLADKSSAVDVEQILGRVLRQPYVTEHGADLLNSSYVLTASDRFNETLQNIVKGLQAAGFSDRDHRAIDAYRDEAKQHEKLPEQGIADAGTGLDIARISLPYDENTEPGSTVLIEIEAIAHQQHMALKAGIESHDKQSADEHIMTEMGDKITRYRLSEANKAFISGIRLPQFYLTVPQSTLFGGNSELLSQEPLLEGFKLSREDSKIGFEQVSSGLFQIDIEETNKSDYDARITKIEDNIVNEPIVAYILSKPKASQIKDIAHRLIRIVGAMYPIADQEIRPYIERILNSLTREQLQDIMRRQLSYADRIKARIKQHADNYAENRFNDLIKIRKVKAAPSWKFPGQIVPGTPGAAIGKSLYEREGSMNNFETTVITDITSLPNIAFWHRNLGRGKGFWINGYKANHYPDFILGSRSGNIILVETKGDDRDNSDSQAKCRLGNKWAELAGPDFHYFMVFDKKAIEGAFNVDKAKELIRQI